MSQKYPKAGKKTISNIPRRKPSQPMRVAQVSPGMMMGSRMAQPDHCSFAIPERYQRRTEQPRPCSACGEDKIKLHKIKDAKGGRCRAKKTLPTSET